jgi:DNA modification methylase
LTNPPRKARLRGMANPNPSPEARVFPAYKTISVADLIPYARNSRTHSDAQVTKIAASIREFGFLNPIIVDGESGIIAGHGRVLAAQKLGLDTLPVIEAAHLTEAQKRAYVIADNRLALDAGWDNDMLKVELSDLQADGFNLELTGFSLDEIAAFLVDPTEGLTDPDAVPDVPEVPVSVLGDVWILGKHRIACGSSTDAHTVEAVLAGVKPHLMVTDPPYGVEYDAAKARATSVGSAKGKVLNDDRADWSDAWALFPGSVAYVWHAMRHAGTVFASLEATEFEVRAEIVWAKSQLVMSRGHYHPQHESCFYAVRGTASWHGDRKQTTLWQIPKPQKSETGHSTQKPIECMKRPIENNSSPGQAVYEPFSGSGTTIIAGEMTGRCVYAIELNPAYVDVAVTRWQDFTGQTATLEGDGRTFDELKAERHGAV